MFAISKRFAKFEGVPQTRQRLERGSFSTASAHRLQERL
jgi:hypothetical protein